MKLKPLDNTVVHCPDRETYDKLMRIYADAGWKWCNGCKPEKYPWGEAPGISGQYQHYVTVKDEFFFRQSEDELDRDWAEVISFPDFLREQGIESKPTVEVGKKYRPKDRTRCGEFRTAKEAAYIVFTKWDGTYGGSHYDIFNATGVRLDYCYGCYSALDELEPYEEPKADILDWRTLKIGDWLLATEEVKTHTGESCPVGTHFEVLDREDDSYGSKLPVRVKWGVNACWIEKDQIHKFQKVDPKPDKLKLDSATLSIDWGKPTPCKNVTIEVSPHADATAFWHLYAAMGRDIKWRVTESGDYCIVPPKKSPKTPFWKRMASGEAPTLSASNDAKTTSIPLPPNSRMDISTVKVGDKLIVTEDFILTELDKAPSMRRDNRKEPQVEPKTTPGSSLTYEQIVAILKRRVHKGRGNRFKTGDPDNIGAFATAAGVSKSAVSKLISGKRQRRLPKKLWPKIEAEIRRRGWHEEKKAEKAAALTESSPVEMLRLSPRTYGALTRAEIGTVGALCGMTRNEVACLRGVGKTSLEEIETTLARHGWSLWAEEQEDAEPEPDGLEEVEVNDAKVAEESEASLVAISHSPFNSLTRAERLTLIRLLPEEIVFKLFPNL